MEERMVVNVRSGEHYDVYVGRGRDSIWGNPHEMENSSDAERQRVIDLFEEDLKNSPELLEKVKELRGKVLACWCAPKACHGDVLVKYANT